MCRDTGEKEKKISLCPDQSERRSDENRSEETFETKPEWKSIKRIQTLAAGGVLLYGCRDDEFFSPFLILN